MYPMKSTKYLRNIIFISSFTLFHDVRLNLLLNNYIHFHLLFFLVAIGCNSRLLADRILVPDTSFQHSSAATLQHGASAAR